MADKKISAMDNLTGATTATGDEFVILDISDTTGGAGGTVKAITRAELVAAAKQEDARIGAFTAADESKLDGIEAGATADQTGAEIKTALFAEADTNNYDDAAVAKLAGIEANATADQTGAEIKAAYEAEADTNAYTDAEKAKVGYLTVTQAVDLDQMETDIAALANGMVYKGDWDASVGTFPGAGSAQTGWFYYVSVGGTVNGVEFSAGDNLVATTDNASTTTYAGNWSKHDQTDAVTAVVGLTGSVSKGSLLTALNVEDGADVTDAVNVEAAGAVMDSDIGVTVQGYDADILKADTADTLTAGFDATSYSQGTVTTGTYTPNPANGNFQHYTNGGAHTLGVPTNPTTLVIECTNNASAGAITTSGFTLVDGDTLTTTDGHDFMFYITVTENFSRLTVTALQ